MTSLQDSKEDYAFSARKGFQAVIIPDFDGTRLFPLTEDVPTCMLTVINRPLVRYALDLLEKCRIDAAIIAVTEDTESAITNFIEEHYREGIQTNIVRVQNCYGSADVLRQVKDFLTTDFIVLGGEIICENFLPDALDLHRSRDALATMILREEILVDEAKKGARKNQQAVVDEEEQEIICLAEDGRDVVVVYKTSVISLEDERLKLPKAILRRYPRFHLRRNLEDVGIYIFSHEVLRWLDHFEDAASLSFEVLPELVKLQYKDIEDHEEETGDDHQISAMEDDVDEDEDLWLIDDDKEEGSSNRRRRRRRRTLKCFAMIVRDQDGYVRRVGNLSSYAVINREMIAYTPNELTPWEQKSGEGSRKKDDNVIGSETHLDAKLTMKGCVIGRGCTIGSKVRLNQCVIGDGVTIEENCVIQNCLISSNTTIERDCNLNECQVGPHGHVSAETRAKGEQFSRDVGL